MHDYLRAIGFSRLDHNRQVRSLLDDVRFDADEMSERIDERLTGLSEYKKCFAKGLGIINQWLVDGETEESFCYMPYHQSELTQFYSSIHLEKTIDDSGYYCEIEDSRVGISIIFRLLNRVDYLKSRDKKRKRFFHISVSGLSTEGTVILGMKKEPNYPVKRMNKIETHQKMLLAARKGDKNAAERLAREDYNQYQSVVCRIAKEDLYTIVDSCFMPYGMNCDCYTIVGDIVAFRTEKNFITGETIVILTVDYNAVLIEIAINEVDLVGEPEVGRRFKGHVWLQGIVDFVGRENEFRL